MALTLFNKLITGNRKNQAYLVGSASAVIMGVAGYRGLEEEDKPISPWKLTSFSVACGALSGLAWSLTKSSRRKVGNTEEQIVRNAVKPVVIIGLTATLRDMEDERYLRKFHNYGNKDSYSSRYGSSYSYYNKGTSSSSSSSGKYSYPSTSSPDLPWATSNYSNIISDVLNGSSSDDDDDDLTAIGLNDELMSAVNRADSSRSYEQDLGLDDDDDDLESIAVPRSASIDALLHA